ncbi:MAG: electron transfer flavoprotein subunit alpha/FixB family protein [Planctomycetales bacterium]|nr:electron transfer flavoprotein subunit alpha/FixB family protein [Planctomycetales bacterium]
MSQDVFVFLEAQHKELRPVTLQVIGAARQLASARGGKLIGLLVGNDLGDLLDQASTAGVDQVLVVEDAALAPYAAEPFTTAIVTAVKQHGGGAICCGNTSIGRDFGPRVAQRLGLGMVADVVAIERADAKPLFRRPIYAGKAYCLVEVQEGDFVVSFRANSFPPAEPAASPADVTRVDVNIDPTALRVKVDKVVPRQSDQVDLTEADVIVSGGVGVKSADGFDTLKPLAAALGASIGASRAAVLADYIDPSHQVGQTGKTVSPNLYIACGISGAIQHLAGMSTARCIVAINTDPDAPIFEVADYGIVGDLFEVVPALTEEVKKLQ